MAPVWAVVVAGGSGSRFGTHKQFAQLGERTVVEWSVAAARSRCSGVVVVVPSGHDGSDFGADVVVTGGSTRSASVRNGLAQVPLDVEVVVIHDAARPLAGPELFDAVVAALSDPLIAGAVCGVPVSDTIKKVAPRHSGTDARSIVVETVDRGDLIAVQTPQAFRADVLRRAHADGAQATDDAALVEGLGETVRVVPGDARNVKLTTQNDLTYAEHLMSQ
jgi:2-C-methyl-D-erythritol 4-phosphate cytidylyltransferase